MFRRWQVPQAAALLKRRVIEAASAAAGRSLAIDENLPLDELLKQAADAFDGTVLLLLDQFEEYFLYNPRFRTRRWLRRGTGARDHATRRRRGLPHLAARGLAF